MGATAHRHPSAPHIGVVQQYYYIPQPMNMPPSYPQPASGNTKSPPIPGISTLPTTHGTENNKDNQDNVTTADNEKSVCDNNTCTGNMETFNMKHSLSYRTVKIYLFHVSGI